MLSAVSTSILRMSEFVILLPKQQAAAQLNSYTTCIQHQVHVRCEIKQNNILPVDIKIFFAAAEHVRIANLSIFFFSL